MSAEVSEGLQQPSSVARESTHKTLFMVVLVVALCAGGVRLLTFERYYPISDYGDEPVYVVLAHEARGLSDQTALRAMYGTLAPFYVDVSRITQSIYDGFKGHPWDIPGEYLYVMRALSALFGLLTALIIMWLGWQLAGAGVALVSGLIWGLSPVVVEFNSLAIPDPLLYMVCALAVTAGLFAWQRRSFAMLVVSFLCGVIAIYTKLWIATALLPFVLATVLLLKADRRWLGRVALLYLVGIGFALHFLLLINPFDTTFKVKNNIADGDFFPMY